MTNQPNERKSLLAKNTILNLLGQILPMLVAVLTIPYIVRNLGVESFGILSIGMIVLGYFSVLDLGLGRATVKCVAEHMPPDQLYKIPELVWTSLALLVTLGFISGLLGASLVPLAVTRVFKMSASDVGEARLSLFIICLSVPVVLGADALRGVLEAAQRFDLVNYIKIPSSICFYGLAALAIPFGLGVPGILLILVLVRFSTACAYLLLCFRVFPTLKKRISISRKAVRTLASFGGWVMVSNVIGPIFKYLERFIIASVLSVSMLTFYSVPYDMISKAPIFATSLASVLFPHFSYHGRKNSSVVSEITSRSLKYLLLVMTPLTAVLVFFAKDILQLWLGPQFAMESVTVFRIIALAFFLNAFSLVPYTSVQALGRPDLKAILDMCLLPTYALLCWWLTVRMGINGSALAQLFITVVDGAFLFGFAWRMKSFSVRDCCRGCLAHAFVASGGLVAAIFAVQSFHPKVIPLLILLAVCFIAYVAVFWTVAVDEDERAAIKKLIRIPFGNRDVSLQPLLGKSEPGVDQ